MASEHERTKATPVDEAPTRPGPRPRPSRSLRQPPRDRWSRECPSREPGTGACAPRRAPVLIASAAGLFVILALAGFLLGSSGGAEEDPAPAATNLQTAGALELSYP